MWSVTSDSSRPIDCSPPHSSVRGTFQNTGVCYRSLLQGIFLTQELNLSLCIAGSFFTTMPPGTPRRDVNRPLFGWPPTPDTVESTGGEGAGWPSQSGAGRSSVHKKFSFACYTKGDPRLRWVMKVDQVGSVARQALRPVSQHVGALIQLLHKEWGLAGVAPWESPQRALRAFPLPAPPFLTKAHRFGPRWLLRPVQSFRVPSRWWVNQNSQELHFLY